MKESFIRPADLHWYLAVTVAHFNSGRGRARWCCFRRALVVRSCCRSCCLNWVKSWLTYFLAANKGAALAPTALGRSRLDLCSQRRSFQAGLS